MDAIQAIVLGIVQGLTEFLPISSSAHLVLTPYVFGWQDQSLAFDVALHFGTLLAVVCYFHRDLRQMSQAWFGSMNGELHPHGRVAWGILLATLPAGFVGLMLQEFVEAELDDPRLIAAMLIIFGLILYWADLRARSDRKMESLSWLGYFMIGCAQAVALIPGASRSGVTMTMGMMLGLSRTDSARFSFLLAIPVILMASGYEAFVMFSAPVQQESLATLMIGTVVAFVSGLGCIHFLLRLLRVSGFLPFVVYRLILGSVLLVLFA